MAKILIVEDDVILQGMYEKKLEAGGHDVILASNGQDCLTLTNSQMPDLIMLDIMLPGGMNGFDVLERLRSNPKTKEIKVLVLTNLDSEADTAKRMGASDYFVKVNTKPDQVIEAVNRLL